MPEVETLCASSVWCEDALCDFVLIFVDLLLVHSDIKSKINVWLLATPVCCNIHRY